MAGHQRAVAVKEKVVRFRPVAAADDVHVARAAGDDEARLRALAFDQRVDGDGPAGTGLVDRRGGKPALADAVDDTLAELRGRGEARGLDEPPGRLVEPDKIGEGASNIDGNNNHASQLPAVRRVVRSQG